MSGPAAVESVARGVVTRRRAWSALVAVVVLGIAVALAAAMPGVTARWAPFTGAGVGSASSGPLAVEVHGATLADAIVVDGERIETTGVFVVLDITIAASEPIDLLSRGLVVDGIRFDATPKAPSSWEESDPAPGMPVRGDVVFEVDAALVDGGGTVELQVAPGLVPAGDLRAQVALRVDVDGTVVDEIAPQVMVR